MTHDETRDELARMDGWNKPGVLYGFVELGGIMPNDAMLFARDSIRNLWSKTKWWRLTTDDSFETSDNHPHPPTLDGANAAFPEGWTWGRGMNPPDRAASWHRWVAWRFDPYTEVQSPDHGRGHEMDDLYALALACRRAMEERK